MAGVFLRQGHLGSEAEPAPTPLGTPPPSRPGPAAGVPIRKEWTQRAATTSPLQLPRSPGLFKNKQTKKTTSGALWEPRIELYSGERKEQKPLKERNKVLFSQGPSPPKETPGKLGLLRLISLWL